MITRQLPSHYSHYSKTSIQCPVCGEQLEEGITYEYDYEVPIYWCERCGKSLDPDDVSPANPFDYND